MYDFDDTSPSALLHAYLEGDLDPFEEPRLFSMLAESHELRAEMHDYLVIGNGVDQDADRIVPGDHLRNQVWRTLGLAQPAPAPAAPPIPFWNMRMIGMAFLAAMTAVLLTLGALMWLDGGALLRREMPAGATTASNPTAPASEHATTPPRALAPEVAPAAGSTIDGAIAGDIGTARRGVRLREQVRRGTLADANGGNDARAMGGADARAIARAPIRSAPSELRITSMQIPADLEPVRSPAPATIGDIAGEPDRRIFLELHGLTASNFPSVELPRTSNPFFKNMNVGIGYVLDADSRIALEAGEEPFSQRYRGVDGGRGVTYSQQPILPWCGVSYRYDLNSLELAPGVHPFAKALAGGTSIGPLFKGTIGLNYLPDSRVGFSLGLEGSALPYPFQGGWFITRKLGVTYGLSLLF